MEYPKYSLRKERKKIPSCNTMLHVRNIFLSWGHFDLKVINNTLSSKMIKIIVVLLICFFLHLLGGFTLWARNMSLFVFHYFFYFLLLVELRPMAAGLKTLNSQINSLCINRSGHKKGTEGFVYYLHMYQPTNLIKPTIHFHKYLVLHPRLKRECNVFLTIPPLKIQMTGTQL